jgi:hypothetical protein
MQRVKGKEQRAKGKGQRAKGKGQRAKGKGQIKKNLSSFVEIPAIQLSLPTQKSHLLPRLFFLWIDSKPHLSLLLQPFYR